MNIKSNIPLKDKNWFGTGGKACWYAEPQSFKDFQDAILFAQTHMQPIALLGSGANILISDEGFNGLVIRPVLTSIERLDNNKVKVGSGADFNELIIWCLAHNLRGLEEFSGIPGTVGGAVYINIHFFEFLLSQFLVQATVINHQTGELRQVSPDWFGFGYNQSRLHEKEWYLIDATFQLTEANDIAIAYARGRRDEMIRYRSRRYPVSRTCGSFFRNFYPHEITNDIQGKKIIYIAYYLEQLGAKGTFFSGKAIISQRHANMIETLEGATSHDVISLARILQEHVYKKFGLLAEPECQLLGFSSYPLYKKEDLIPPSAHSFTSTSLKL